MNSKEVAAAVLTQVVFQIDPSIRSEYAKGSGSEQCMQAVESVYKAMLNRISGQSGVPGRTI